MAGIGETAGQPQPAVIHAGHRRTFPIQPGPPRHVSYASEIAEQYGIGCGQLEDCFRQRALTLPG